VNGLYEFDVTRDAGVAYSAGVALVVTVTLPAGREFAMGNAPAITTTGGTPATGGVAAGGTAGSNEISFNITPAAGNTGINIANLLVAATDSVAASAEMTVSVVNAAGGTEVDGTPETDKTVFVPSVSALAGITITPTGTPAVVNTDTATKSVFNRLASKSLGTVAIDAFPTPNGTDAPYVSLVNATPAVMTVDFQNANIASTTTTANFPNGTAGIDTSALGVNGVVGANDIVYTATTSGLTAATSLTIVGEDDAAEAAIAVQAPTLTNVAVGLTGAAFTSPVVLTDTVNDLDEITRAGAAGGDFDWVGEVNTNSIFRVTGLAASSPVTYNVTFSNTTGGQDGTFSGSGTSNAAGEIVLNSFNAFGTSNAGYGRGDVAFSFDGANPANVDVDRLMVRLGVVSAFGNDNGSGAED